MMKKRTSFWANTIGHTLAHLQDGVDDVTRWGFRKLRSVDSSKLPKKKADENTYLYGAKRAARGTLSFLGNVGDAFYSKYGELKQEDDEQDTRD